MLAQCLATAVLVLANLPRAVAEIPATTNIVGSVTSEGLFTIQTSVPTSLPPKTPEVTQSSEAECMAVCTGDPGCNSCKPSTTATGQVITDPLLSTVTGGMTIQTSTTTDVVPSTVTGGMTIETSTTTVNAPPSIATSAPTVSQPAQSSPTGAPQTTAAGSSVRVITALTVVAPMLGFAWSLL